MMYNTWQNEILIFICFYLTGIMTKMRLGAIQKCVTTFSSVQHN